MLINQDLDALFTHSTEGIIIADKDGHMMRINPAACKMFGYENKELEGQKVEILIPRKAAKSHEKHRESFNKSPHSRSMGQNLNLNGLKKDGTEFPVEISLSPFESDGKKFVIAFIIDITLRKLAQVQLQNYSIELEKQVEKRTQIMKEAIKELEKTKDELKNALGKEKELNELKSRFVSMASHEFRTPLATILSSLSLISKYSESGDKEKQTKHVGRIKNSVNHLTDILNDMLSLSKLEEGAVNLSFEYFNAKEFIEGLLLEMNPLAKTGQLLVYTHEGEKVEVNLDKKVMRHILFNLISNAIKFSPENKKIEIKSIAKNNKFEIQIRDQGIGISKEDQKHLFERFFRGQNAANIQGTGLGLNIVAKYVELLNGIIEYESQLEQGTTFKITF
ncbi:MAG: PAS domain S-box protein [Sphingobacteriaceae bacterium]|nr:PAS domain S-box protein [Sphingobacteriaceae bacterium]